MGITDFIEEAAGAVAAEQALKAVDPNAGIVTEGVAAVAGFEGVSLVKEHFAGEAQAQDTSAQPAAQDDAQADAALADDSQNS